MVPTFPGHRKDMLVQEGISGNRMPVHILACESVHDAFSNLLSIVVYSSR